jgi:hypothetical protein
MSRGGRRATVVREALGILRAFAQARLEAEQLQGLGIIYRAVLAAIPELQRDLQSCRQRVDSLHKRFVDRRPASDRMGELGPDRAMFAAGFATIDDVARDRLAELPDDDWLQLDVAVQTRIARQFKPMFDLLRSNTDQTRPISEAIIDELRSFLPPRLGERDVAVRFFQREDSEAAAERELAEAYDEAVPELTARRLRAEGHFGIVAVPRGEAGQRFASLARQVLGDQRIVELPGNSDIVFQREQTSLTAPDLPQLGEPARASFTHISQSEQAPPHTRSDVIWSPVPRNPG